MSAAKRKRADDSPSKGEPTRSDVWFLDGNIILEAERKQFRIHRGVLAKHSDVFKDMFDVPQPPNEPVLEGCPIVHLSDSAQDIELLLNALYDGFSQSSDALPIPLLCALIRLGHKYAFLRFRDDAVSRLEHEFSKNMMHFMEPRAYTKIKIMENCQMLDLLVLEMIIKGVPRRRGSAIHLSPDEKLAWAVGLSRQREASLKYTFQWLERVPYHDCTSNNCRKNAGRVSHSILFDASRTLYPSGLCKWKPQWSEKLCARCGRTAKREHEEGQVKFWEAVPSFFGLPAWPHLSNFDINRK
ncbi:hypothetical protein D9615_008825 [Tricholomella constricta]|uniref:BTB domain-containing protein n=1 Tax=Tricholomella constricta TaxID=117010 RepID=A0A8H5GZX0_9AGAR|nr:hypothetical protein D9615_008825 [Tricholomella constricta]